MRKTAFLAVAAALFLVAEIAALGFFALANRRATEQFFLDQYLSLSRSATQLVELGIATQRVDAVQRMLGDLQSNALFVGAVVYDIDGDALLTLPPDLEVPSAVAAALAGAETATSGAFVYEIGSLRDPDGLETGRLLLVFSFESMNAEVRKAFVSTVLFGLVILVPVMALIGWLLAGREKQLRRYEQVQEELGRSEEQLRQAQKMEAIGQLTGGIAHDFNNLLTVILTNAQFMEDALLPGQTGVRSDLKELVGAADRGRGMVRKLLSFSRREALSFRAVDLPRLVDELSSSLGRLLPASIRIRTSSDEHLPPAYADPGSVEQILLNLATNARDAMPDGGLLHIQVRRGWLDEEHRVTHGWGEPGEYVRLLVSDTGVGMDKSTAQKIFEPFFTTKAVGEGTGLGMAMIYGLVKQHNGYVQIQTEVGQGTTVTVYFPIARGSVTASAPAPERVEMPGGTETILLAEDEEPVRRAARRVLERCGYTVLTSENGEEALRVFQAHRSDIDLVISDVIMPKAGGPELYAAIRSEAQDVKFIFMSGYSAQDVRGSVEISPTVPLIHKPWSVAELLNRVREVLDEQPAVDSSGGEQ